MGHYWCTGYLLQAKCENSFQRLTLSSCRVTFCLGHHLANRLVLLHCHLVISEMKDLVVCSCDCSSCHLVLHWVWYTTLQTVSPTVSLLHCFSRLSLHTSIFSVLTWRWNLSTISLKARLDFLKLCNQIKLSEISWLMTLKQFAEIDLIDIFRFKNFTH